VLSVRIFENREDFGLRWQPAGAKRSEDWSAAATPLFDCGQSFQSGVALRFPPQSKKIWLRLRRAMPLLCSRSTDFYFLLSQFLFLPSRLCVEFRRHLSNLKAIRPVLKTGLFC
jgi:hypothetical protein